MGTTEREAFSVRGASRAFGISSDVLRREIRAGRLKASRLSPRRFVILRRDLEEWLRSLAIRPGSHAEAVVARRLRHEQDAA